MREFELHEAIAVLPRTTFTEFLRSLDPLCVAKDVDPAGQTPISVGMYQTLNMGSTIDDWGVRKLYSQLLQRMLVLVKALKASGQVLQSEEYIYLLRCAGAASDPMGAKWIWNEMVRTQTTDWRQSEAYTEYISARFLTRPLYTGYDKTKRMVLPRDLHWSRLKLARRRVSGLDRLRFNTRLSKLLFRLNKDVPHTEDLTRMMRKKGPATRLLKRILKDSHRMSEPLLCALMIAFGRIGSLRFVGSRILNQYFGIRMMHLTYNQGTTNKTQIDHIPYRIRPTIRLLQAVVETYGCNGEIFVAFQLVDHISKNYHLPIPLFIWQDLLEWTYIMNSPSASTAWKYAGMLSKIPSSSVVELIWTTMTSAPYHVQPGFEQYSILIRNLLARNQFSKALPYMRQAISFYDTQCREYENAVLEYVQMLRDGVHIGESLHRYERARFEKAHMWYDIQTWCRQYLSNIRSFNPSNPLAIIAVPDFIREFAPFVTNPARYRTATGYVSLHDPARERLQGIVLQHLPVAIPMRHRRKWVFQRAKLRKLLIRSSNTLEGHVPVWNLDLVTLLTTTSRTKPPAKERDELEEAAEKKSDEGSSYDDDEDYF